MSSLRDAFNRKGERIVLLGDNGYPVNCDEIRLPHAWVFYQPEDFTYCRWCGAKPANEESERITATVPSPSTGHTPSITPDGRTER